MSKYSRLKYNNINVDFDRGLTAFSPIPIQVKNTIFSRAGIGETLNFYRYWPFSFARAHAHAGLKNQLAAFWDYVRTGASFAFWHDRDLAGYWTFEGKSLKSIDEIDGTFTRATAAFYNNPTTGFLEEVNTGVSRFPAGKFGLGILIERVTTNVLIKSTEFNDAGWNATNITVTTNSGLTRSPALNGWDTTADLAELTSTTGSFQRDTTTNIGTNNGVFSVYLKHLGSGTKTGTIYLKRVDTDATLNSKAITITPEWQRFFVAYDSVGSITADWRARIELNGASGNDFAVWGGMLEAATDILTPSSFVVTSTIAVTRNAETLVYAASNFFDDEPARGTIAFWYSPSFASTAIGLGRFFFEMESFGGVFDGIELFLNSSGGLLATVYGKDGVLNASASGTIGSFAAGDFIHLAMTWDTTISDSVKIYVNGVLNATSSNSAFSPTRIGTNFRLGHDHNGNQIDGVLDDLLIRRDVLTAAEIAEIARAQQPLGYDRNYWAALMIEERQFTQNRLPGVPLWDIEIPVREVLS